MDNAGNIAKKMLKKPKKPELQDKLQVPERKIKEITRVFGDHATDQCVTSCDVCGGCGWLDVHYEDGGVAMAPCPNALEREFLMKTGLTQGEVDSLNWDEVYEIEGQNPQKAISAIQKVFVKGFGLIYLYGGFGVAKTLILKITVAVLARSGVEAVYVNMADILEDLKSGFGDKIKSAENRLDILKEKKVLCIDEFGRIQKTEWAEMIQFRLFDHRHVQALRGETTTIIASNIPREKLEGAIADRLSDGRHSYIDMPGESVRPGMTEEDKF